MAVIGQHRELLSELHARFVRTVAQQEQVVQVTHGPADPPPQRQRPPPATHLARQADGEPQVRRVGGGQKHEPHFAAARSTHRIETRSTLPDQLQFPQLRQQFVIAHLPGQPGSPRRNALLFRFRWPFGEVGQQPVAQAAGHAHIHQFALHISHAVDARRTWALATQRLPHVPRRTSHVQLLDRHVRVDQA